MPLMYWPLASPGMLYPCYLGVIHRPDGPHSVLDSGGCVDPLLAHNRPSLPECFVGTGAELSAWVTHEVGSIIAGN